MRATSAWLANWLPPVLCITVICGGVFGYWTMFTELSRHPHLPPDQLRWVLGTIWVLFSLYAAVVASADYRVTLKQWEYPVRPRPKGKAQ